MANLPTSSEKIKAFCDKITENLLGKPIIRVVITVCR